MSTRVGGRVVRLDAGGAERDALGLSGDDYEAWVEGVVVLRQLTAAEQMQQLRQRAAAVQKAATEAQQQAEQATQRQRTTYGTSYREGPHQAPSQRGPHL